MQSQKIKEMAEARNNEEKILVEDTYKKMINKKMEEITEFEKTIKYLEVETEKNKTEKIKKVIEYFDEIIKSDNPSKEVLSQVLDKIILNKGKNIEFKLKMNIDKLV